MDFRYLVNKKNTCYKYDNLSKHDKALIDGIKMAIDELEYLKDEYSCDDDEMLLDKMIAEQQKLAVDAAIARLEIRICEIIVMTIDHYDTEYDEHGNPIPDTADKNANAALQQPAAKEPKPTITNANEAPPMMFGG